MNDNYSALDELMESMRNSHAASTSAEDDP